MYLAGVWVRRVEDITEALWGTRVSPSTVSDLNKKIYGTIEAWRHRPIEGEHPYVYLDGIVLKRSWAGEVRNVSLLVAIGVNNSGYREILGICEGAKEDKAGWSAFLKHLKERGLNGIRLIISDACLGLAESAAEFFPEAAWQRCVVHWYRNIFSHVPSTRVREIAAMLKAIHASEDIVAAREKAIRVIEKLRGLRLTKRGYSTCSENFSAAKVPADLKSMRSDGGLTTPIVLSADGTMRAATGGIGLAAKFFSRCRSSLTGAEMIDPHRPFVGVPFLVGAGGWVGSQKRNFSA
jgi:transposase-like protein